MSYSDILEKYKDQISVVGSGEKSPREVTSDAGDGDQRPIPEAEEPGIRASTLFDFFSIGPVEKRDSQVLERLARIYDYVSAKVGNSKEEIARYLTEMELSLGNAVPGEGRLDRIYQRVRMLESASDLLGSSDGVKDSHSKQEERDHTGDTAEASGGGAGDTEITISIRGN